VSLVSGVSEVKNIEVSYEHLWTGHSHMCIPEVIHEYMRLAVHIRCIISLLGIVVKVTDVSEEFTTEFFYRLDTVRHTEDFTMNKWRVFDKEAEENVYTSPDIVRVIK
jgi:hypothetical protein